MIEIKVTVEVPELTEALNNLAVALVNKGADAPAPAPAAEKKTASRSKSKKKDEAPEKEAEVQAAPTPAPTPQAVQAQAAPAPQAAPPMPQPVQQAPVQQMPAPQYQQYGPATPQQPQQVTFEMIANAGAFLVDRGMMNQVLAVMQKYGAQAVNQLRPEVYPMVAAEYRALGAPI